MAKADNDCAKECAGLGWECQLFHLAHFHWLLVKYVLYVVLLLYVRPIRYLVALALQLQYQSVTFCHVL